MLQTHVMNEDVCSQNKQSVGSAIAYPQLRSKRNPLRP